MSLDEGMNFFDKQILISISAIESTMVMETVAMKEEILQVFHLESWETLRNKIARLFMCIIIIRLFYQQILGTRNLLGSGISCVIFAIL